jgi:hypothetical protein
MMVSRSRLFIQLVALPIGMGLVVGLALWGIWDLPLVVVVALSVVVPFPLLIGMRLLALRLLGKRHPFYQRAVRHLRRNFRGEGGSDDVGGMAGTRIPRRPILPSLAARAAQAPPEPDASFMQPHH